MKTRTSLHREMEPFPSQGKGNVDRAFERLHQTEMAEVRRLRRHAPIIVDASPHEEMKFKARRFALQNLTAAFFCAVLAVVFAIAEMPAIWVAVAWVGAVVWAVCALLALFSPKVIR